MKLVYYKSKSPANSSRAFLTHAEAVSQPEALINLVFSSKYGFVFNSKFNSSLIRHDDAYNTSDVFHLDESMQYLQPLIDSMPLDLIVDIGCGQGELVKKLESKGLKALGFDPTLREPSSVLLKKYFDSDDLRERKTDSILFILRCVLPHIQNPFHFVDNLMKDFPNSKVLIEFQDLDYLLDNNLWLNISHDHVNYFNHASFRHKYQVLCSGSFAGGEWGFTLLNGKVENSFRIEFQSRFLLSNKFKKIRKFKRSQLLKMAMINDYMYIYGAAGKGTQLCHELSSLGYQSLKVIDQNEKKHNFFLESSGYQIISISTARENLTDDSVILVLNPRHFEFVKLNFPKCQVKNFMTL